MGTGFPWQSMSQSGDLEEVLVGGEVRSEVTVERDDVGFGNKQWHWFLFEQGLKELMRKEKVLIEDVARQVKHLSLSMQGK